MRWPPSLLATGGNNGRLFHVNDDLAFLLRFIESLQGIRHFLKRIALVDHRQAHIS